MSGAEKFGQFMIFLLLTIITVGIYPLYWGVINTKEIVVLLKDIREEVRRASRLLKKSI